MPRLSSRLLKWYRKNKRMLPWRDRPDPYVIWVSEVMLQQTRVETVISYFEQWVKWFPDIQTLADASEREVLKAWEGLGYYSRARNLHKAAKMIIREYQGNLPRDLDELQKLPGIGRYTAGAIASIAFGMDEPALDGNLKRVYARLFDISVPVDSTKGEKIFWEIASENLPRGRAGDFNQALMDLGATICIPQKPRCLICPLMKECQAWANGTQELRPMKKPKKAVPHYFHVASVILKRGRVLLAQRTSNGLLGGLWEFPNGRVDGDPARELLKVLKGGYNLQVRKKDTLGIVQHAYTHFKVTEYVFLCDVDSLSKEKNMNWVSLRDLDDYPMGKIDRQIADMIKQLNGT